MNKFIYQAAMAFCGEGTGAFFENKVGRASRYGAQAMPRSVMIAVIMDAGVTSKAGCRALVPWGASLRPRTVVTSSTERSSIGIMSPFGVDRSMVEVGATM